MLPVAEVCAAATEANTQYPQQLTALIQAGVEKVLAGDTAGGDKATADAVALAKEWTGDLRASAAQTDDAALRTAITDLADKLAPAEAGTMSLNDMSAIVEDGTKAIAAQCPDALTQTPSAENSVSSHVEARTSQLVRRASPDSIVVGAADGCAPS